MPAIETRPSITENNPPINLCYSTESQTSESPKEVTDLFPDIAIPITTPNDRIKYLHYLEELTCYNKGRFGRAPQKLQAQYLIQNEGIGDPNTILVPAKDHDASDYVVNSFLKKGRSPIWIGTCINNDWTEQVAATKKNSREQAKFWRGIHSPAEWQSTKEKIDAYAAKHEELVLKIFPQDKNYSNGRIVTIDDGIRIVVKMNQLNARDDQATKRYVNIDIIEKDHGHILSTKSEGEDALIVLNALKSQKSLRYFRNLQDAIWRLPPKINLLNPEFMLDTDHGTIGFMIDLIWGTSTGGNTIDLPDIAGLLSVAQINPHQHTK